MQEYEIIIVGGGPAGCATALKLASLNPALAAQTLLLDKAVFPRSKLCGGGVTVEADKILAELEVRADVPDYPVHVSRFVLPGGCLTYEQPNHFRVVRRDQFDELLLNHAKRRGVSISDGEAVETILLDGNSVIVRTSRDEYRTKVLIGADGSNSTTRQALGLTRTARLMIAMETFVPLNKTNIHLPDHTAIFDVSVTTLGVPGYCWIFPTASMGRQVVSLGIMAAPLLRSKPLGLKQVFECWLGKHGVDFTAVEIASHPILRYEPRSKSSANHILLTGDAAGIDPLFGEGIHCALALGMVTAHYAEGAFLRNDFTFKDYEKTIRSSSIGSVMRRRRLLANRVYSRPTVSGRFLQYGSLLKWLTMLRLTAPSGNLNWEPT